VLSVYFGGKTFLSHHKEFFKGLSGNLENCVYSSCLYVLVTYILSEAEKILAKEKNIIQLFNTEPIVVVGDLHGQIEDLAKVMKLGGNAMYIFNGDFVDRGENSTEVLCCLAALKIASPDRIFLNRGNHECGDLTKVFDFLPELKRKYGSDAANKIFDVAENLFASLPIGCLIANHTLVVHAGVNEDMTLYQMQRFPRLGMKDVLKSDNLMQDVLWSDPNDDLDSTCVFNTQRNAGKTYSLGVVRDFLQRENLKRLVRSHEAVIEGVVKKDCGDDTELYTVFSASNCPRHSGFSDGAALKFVKGNIEIIKWTIEKDDIDKIFKFDVSHILNYDNDGDGKVSREEAARDPEILAIFDELDSDNDGHLNMSDIKRAIRLLRRNRVSLMSYFSKNKYALMNACEAIGKNGKIKTTDWLNILNDVLQVEGVDWQGLLHIKTNEVNYKQILNNAMASSSSGQNMCVKGSELHDLYEHYDRVAAIFHWIDKDHSGELDKDEIRKACEIINSKLPIVEKLDPNKLFSEMDLDNSGEVDLNEFLEISRKYF